MCTTIIENMSTQRLLLARNDHVTKTIHTAYRNALPAVSIVNIFHNKYKIMYSNA